MQDIFLTETAEFADVILPASSFLEKTGTYTNTDRRVQIGRPAMDPPGQARLDWRDHLRAVHALRLPDETTTRPSEVFDELVELMPCYHGLSYDALAGPGKLYPLDDAHPDGKVVLFDETFATDDGRAPRARRVGAGRRAARRRVPDRAQHRPSARALAHRDDDPAQLRARRDRAGGRVSLHPADAGEIGVAGGDYVRITSRRGTIRIKVRISDRESRGACFIPFHFREAAANVLTNDAIDPFGKIPEFKFCAVRIERA